MSDGSVVSSEIIAARRQRRVAIICASIALGMIGMSYAAVPLYQIFCQVTGFGGTPQVAAQPSDTVIDQSITMRFDANVSDKLNWKFEPVEHKFDLKLGENRIAMYRATNVSDEATTGTATFNVYPNSAGIYFNKIECFCFTEQTLQPGESVEMPVSFYVDPEIVKDSNAGHISELTLSYTFFPTEKSAQADVAASSPKAGG